MSAIDNLRASVDAVNTSATDGFAAIQSAMTELATDITNLPQNADVQTEADRLAASATAIGTAAGTFAQAIRDAIPTP